MAENAQKYLFSLKSLKWSQAIFMYPLICFDWSLH